MNIPQKIIVTLAILSIFGFVGSVKYKQYELSKDTYSGTVLSKYSTTDGRHNVLRVDFDSIATQDIVVNRGYYLQKAKGSRVTIGYKFSLLEPGGSGAKDMSALGEPTMASILIAMMFIWVGLIIFVVSLLGAMVGFWSWIGDIGKKQTADLTPLS